MQLGEEYGSVLPCRLVATYLLQKTTTWWCKLLPSGMSDVANIQQVTLYIFSLLCTFAYCENTGMNHQSVVGSSWNFLWLSQLSIYYHFVKSGMNTEVWNLKFSMLILDFRVKSGINMETWAVMHMVFYLVMPAHLTPASLTATLMLSSMLHFHKQGTSPPGVLCVQHCISHYTQFCILTAVFLSISMMIFPYNRWWWYFYTPGGKNNRTSNFSCWIPSFTLCEL